MALAEVLSASSEAKLGLRPGCAAGRARGVREQAFLK
jgi:hypothetical protein